MKVTHDGKFALCPVRCRDYDKCNNFKALKPLIFNMCVTCCYVMGFDDMSVVFYYHLLISNNQKLRNKLFGVTFGKKK